MPYVPDFTLTGEEHLLALINQTNEKTYTFSEIYFEVPTPNGPGSQYNTSCIVRTVPGSGYKNSTTIQYNRLDMNTMFTGAITLNIDSTANIQTVLDRILTEYGLNITTDDVSLLDEGIAARSLVANDGSYLLTGQCGIAFLGAGNSVPDNALLGFDGEPILGFDGEYILGFGVA